MIGYQNETFSEFISGQFGIICEGGFAVQQLKELKQLCIDADVPWQRRDDAYVPFDRAAFIFRDGAVRRYHRALLAGRYPLLRADIFIGYVTNVGFYSTFPHAELETMLFGGEHSVVV